MKHRGSLPRWCPDSCEGQRGVGQSSMNSQSSVQRCNVTLAARTKATRKTKLYLMRWKVPGATVSRAFSSKSGQFDNAAFSGLESCRLHVGFWRAWNVTAGDRWPTPRKGLVLKVRFSGIPPDKFWIWFSLHAFMKHIPRFFVRSRVSGRQTWRANNSRPILLRAEKSMIKK